MIEIRLANKKYNAFVDEIDSDLATVSWCESPGKSIQNQNKNKKRSLARVIAERIKGERLESDEFAYHRNRNPLDNRRENIAIVLRHCIIKHCRKSSKPRTSIYKGVHWSKTRRKWCSQISINYGEIRKTLGMFDSERDAAMAHDQAAKKWFGKCAYLNFPEASL